MSFPSQSTMTIEPSANRPAPHCGRPWGREGPPVARAHHCASRNTHGACHAQPVAVGQPDCK
eukprot:3777743-Amphidinium_carterae.1